MDLKGALISHQEHFPVDFVIEDTWRICKVINKTGKYIQLWWVRIKYKIEQFVAIVTNFFRFILYIEIEFFIVVIKFQIQIVLKTI